MKTVGIREAKALLSAYVTRSQSERVLIMKHGKPAALLTGVEGRDLEDVVLEANSDFWKFIHARRKAPSTMTLEQARQRLGIAPPRARDRGRSKPKK
jgi:prevent-host-death family protein